MFFKKSNICRQKELLKIDVYCQNMVHDFYQEVPEIFDQKVFEILFLFIRSSLKYVVLIIHNYRSRLKNHECRLRCTGKKFKVVEKLATIMARMVLENFILTKSMFFIRKSLKSYGLKSTIKIENHR